jgi:excinuclease ABC subunit B
MDFRLVSDYTPKGDQGNAIQSLTRGIFDREQHQVLLGVTGSGKTYTMAKVIEQVNRPALVMAHNKTLASKAFSPTTPSNTLSPTTISINRRPMFLRRTCI